MNIRVGKNCPQCQGTCLIERYVGYHNDYETDTCPRCGGSGYMDKDKVKNVQVKQKVVTESELEITTKDVIAALREMNYPIPEDAVLLASNGVVGQETLTFWWKKKQEI